QRSLGGDVDDAGVARVEEDLADVLGLFQADLLPALAAVKGLVDAVAVADRALAVVLAGADPDDARVLGVEGDIADRVGALVVEDGGPGDAGVGGLPDATRADGREVVAAVARVDGQANDPAGEQGRPDGAELEAGVGFGGEERVGGLLGAGLRGGGWFAVRFLGQSGQG